MEQYGQEVDVNCENHSNLQISQIGQISPKPFKIRSNLDHIVNIYTVSGVINYSTFALTYSAQIDLHFCPFCVMIGFHIILCSHTLLDLKRFIS